jgi:2-dehydropantoate 2-reductase
VSRPIAVWGAGAIGGTLGAAFIRAGHEVAFIDQAADHVAAINAQGVRIDGPIFRDTVKARAFLPGEVDGRFDRIFLAVKAHHTETATQALKPHLAEDGYVVSAQNGLNELVIGRILGDARVVGAFVNFGADYMEPGVVHYSGRGTMVVGELDGRRTARAEEVHALMSTLDSRAVLSDNVWGYLWGKMIYGAQLFATALTNDSIADVFAMERYRPVLADLAVEIATVAGAKGVRIKAFDGFDPTAFRPGASRADTWRSFDEMVAHNRRSTKSHSGIWRDIAVRKRKTEVDGQVLPIVEIGRAAGVPTPLTARLVEMIHEIEAGQRRLDLRNLDDLAETLVAGRK